MQNTNESKSESQTAGKGESECLRKGVKEGGIFIVRRKVYWRPGVRNEWLGEECECERVGTCMCVFLRRKQGGGRGRTSGYIGSEEEIVC